MARKKKRSIKRLAGSAGKFYKKHRKKIHSGGKYIYKNRKKIGNTLKSAWKNRKKIMKSGKDIAAAIAIAKGLAKAIKV